MVVRTGNILVFLALFEMLLRARTVTMFMADLIKMRFIRLVLVVVVRVGCIKVILRM